jgi:hypothetical protein
VKSSPKQAQGPISQEFLRLPVFKVTFLDFVIFATIFAPI